MHSAEKAAILVSTISECFLPSTFASRRQVSQYLHFSPSIRLWIVFFNNVTEIYRPIKTITSFLSILKSKLTNLSYKESQNLSSPSDCIQFSIRSNKRMTISCIIHISDLRNSTVNRS